MKARVLVVCAAIGALGRPSADPPASLRAGEDLQRALDAARPGDVIVLEAGGVFTGPFRLPEKAGSDWITIRSSAADRLPPPGTRVTPADAALMPKLEAAGGVVVAAAPGAHHYRFVGIEIRPAAGQFLHNLVTLGTDETSLDQLPHHFAFERCYLHGDPRRGSRRGVALNSRETTIADSHFADFKEVGSDSQAIAGWNGAGPFQLVNNHLEGAGENVLFGGVDPSIKGLVPSDIEIRRNRFVKPLAWKAGERGYEGTAWSVKNLFELKNARRVVVDGNVFEHNWVQSQNGFAILFTVRNQDGTAPWSVVEDVIFTNNVVRRTGSGINILGRDEGGRSEQTKRIRIRNNLFEDVGGERWGGGGRLFQILSGTAEVAFEHNTAFHSGNIITVEGPPNHGFVFRDNIAAHNDYGIIGDGTAPGSPTLAPYFPEARFQNNVIVGADPGRHPAGNFFPPSWEGVGFVDLVRGNYRLSDRSPYRGKGTDGKDVGADLEALERALGSALPEKE
jgi:hypothetical protein